MSVMMLSGVMRNKYLKRDENFLACTHKGVGSAICRGLLKPRPGLQKGI